MEDGLLYSAMPTPIYALRLPQETQDALRTLALAGGWPNGRACAREILEVCISGDVARLSGFIDRLTRQPGSQLPLTLVPDNVAQPPAGASKGIAPRKRAKRGKRGKGGRRGRST